MRKTKRAFIIVLVLLVIAISAFFYFFIPGAWIGGIDDISEESKVTIKQTTYTRDKSGDGINFTDTVSEYDLNAEQIAMLQEFIRRSSFTRTLKSTLYNSVTNVDNYNYYDIIIRDDNFMAVHDTTIISITWGYFSGFKQAGNGWIKINNPEWEDTISQILALSADI
jgi:predicted PurR-regulated permease PerM